MVPTVVNDLEDVVEVETLGDLLGQVCAVSLKAVVTHQRATVLRLVSAHEKRRHLATTTTSSK